MGPTPFPSCTHLQASTIPLSIPLPKKKETDREGEKKSMNKRTVVQIEKSMSRFSIGFWEMAQEAEIFCFCLLFKWV